MEILYTKQNTGMCREYFAKEYIQNSLRFPARKCLKFILKFTEWAILGLHNLGVLPSVDLVRGGEILSIKYLK